MSIEKKAEYNAEDRIIQLNGKLFCRQVIKENNEIEGVVYHFLDYSIRKAKFMYS